jgi:glutamate racemase
VGVIGTRGTLTSAKFGKLLASLHGQAEFVVQPCDGLAHAIERSVDRPVPASPQGTETWDLCERYIQAMGAFGTAAGEMDTLVLGCTHYIFAERDLRTLVGSAVRFIETGEPVARQTRRLLEGAGLLAAPQEQPAAPDLQLYTTGGLPQLQAAARRWLDVPADGCHTVAITSETTETTQHSL